MKLSLTKVATCIALMAAPTFAFQYEDANYEYQSLIDQVDKAEVAWKAKRPTKPFWDDIASHIPGLTDVSSKQKARLARAIKDLTERAQNAHLIMSDFWRTKGMIMDGTCSAQVRILWKKAKNRDATRAQFEYCADLLRQRADAAKEHPDLRQLLQDGINKLMKQYLAGEELTAMQTSFFDDEMVRSMLDRAVAWLEDMAVERNATREQFEYVRDLMKDRARIWSEDLEMQALVRRVEAELDRLLQRDLRTASFSREDFLKLREMCLKKARAVVSSGGTAAG